MQAIFLDIETTGLDVQKHRPIDLALKIVNISQAKVEASYQALIQTTQEEWKETDPNSLVVNGYNWNQLQDAKSRQQVKEEIIELFSLYQIERGKAFFVCQNPGFDRPFFSHIIDPYEQEKLNWPYHWLDLASMYWVQYINSIKGKSSLPECFSLSKNEIAKYYQLPPEEEPHKAMNGVNHLISCYEAVVGMQFQESR